jgi:mono/diheme cytochrome c family protein
MNLRLAFSVVALSAAAGVALAQAPASAPAAGAAASAAAPAAGDKPYKVTNGTQVDPFTMKGFRTWRSGACDRCHGPNQEGLVGPSLIDGLKVLSKDDFKKTVHDGRLEKGMPSFAENPTVMEGLDNLYAYLKGRSDGAITSARVTEAAQ